MDKRDLSQLIESIEAVEYYHRKFDKEFAKSCTPEELRRITKEEAKARKKIKKKAAKRIKKLMKQGVIEPRVVVRYEPSPLEKFCEWVRKKLT